MDRELWIIKIGSNSIVDHQGALNRQAVSDLCRQIAAIKELGHQVILVSSGAVAAGNKISKNLAIDNQVNLQQAKAAIGQPMLVQAYQQEFNQYSQLVAQVLLTKNDFEDDLTSANILGCLESLLNSGVIPIVNENDVTSIRELMFTDNDELASLLGLLFEVDRLVILTEVQGLFDRHPDDPEAQLIGEVNNFKNVYQFISEDKSVAGRGGMLSKVRSCQKLAQLGTACVITSLNDPDCLIKLLNQESSGTRFIISEKIIKNRKKKILQKFNRAKAKIVVNQCLAKLLMENDKVFSLLPVGVEAIFGDFQANDLIEIIDENQNTLALGLAEYDSTLAREYQGLANKPHLVHYDYLFNFS